MSTSLPPPAPPPKPNKNRALAHSAYPSGAPPPSSSSPSSSSQLPPPPSPPRNGSTLSSGAITTIHNNGIGNGDIASPTSATAAAAVSHIRQSSPESIDNRLPPDGEQVVMTPRGKTSNSTVILIERKLVDAVNDRAHVAGGDHKGIIINKEQTKDHSYLNNLANLSLEFRVFLVSANTGQHTQESRRLRFWFRSWLTDSVDRQAHVAQDFFRELVSPKEFPRDYVGFIKKIMKLMQKGYNDIQTLEIELKILEQTSAPPSRPPRPGHLIFCYGNHNDDDRTELMASRGSGSSSSGSGSTSVSMEDSQFEIVPLTAEKVLELIEQAYPNPITPGDLARDNGWTEEDVMQVMIALQNRGLIKAMEFNSFTRIHHEDKEIKVVKQMPTIASNKQPTIAIITAQYCEKLAVDAMFENKETFVRYTTVGESNVYTLGNIGAHRIVSTKLPSVGSSREAMIAAGNTTTRLLGTFQKVDYVFIVGVAGGIPHYTDYKKHVRLGDVVIAHVAQSGQTQQPPPPPSSSSSSNGHAAHTRSSKSSSTSCIYVYSSGGEMRTYYPVNPCLQDIGKCLYAELDGRRPWETYFDEGLAELRSKTDTDFSRPAANTDKLYMNIGNRDVIEVAHPQPVNDNASTVDGSGAGDEHTIGQMRLHLGPIGSGRDLVRSDTSRTEFAKAHGLVATDVEMGSVLDSITGNCRDSFILVKGIADYKDGMSTRKWQNYASLAAASVMKSIVCAMDAPTNV